jgi:SAM-dependent methyltransferase
MTSEERVHHPLFARLYLRGSRQRSGTEDEHRRTLLAGLSGRVIEVGAGNGLNFPHYPPEVEHVLAVEPEPTMRGAAVEAAAAADTRIEVVDGVSGKLPAEAGSCDAGVASLMLCSVPDPQRALAEFRRVIAPGGELRFYEHVVAEDRRAATVQRLADAVIWPRLAGNCHLARDTAAEIAAAGFAIERLDRFTFSPGPPIPPIPHILGMARKLRP